MGGLAGHMMHLYDNPEMTFNHMMGIMTQASQGGLKGTEKTDGVNIFLGYKDGTARAARNPTDAATGGMTIEDLIAREYKGGDKIRQVYVKSTQAFESAVNSLSEEQKSAIFGEDGNIFYNAEVIHPDAANVINYSGNAIIVHRDGHKRYNPETNGVEPFDASQTSQQLDQAINKFEQEQADDSFSVSRMAVQSLKAMTNKQPLKAARAQIRTAISKYGLDDSAKVKDLIAAGLRLKMTDIDEEYMDVVVGRMIGEIPHRDPRVKELPKEVKTALSAYWKQAKPMIAQILSPVSSAVHDFSVEALKGLRSVLVLDNEAEVDRQKQEVAAAVKAIEKYSGDGSDRAMEILVQQMVKLKDVENISTAAEGFVFTDDNGDTYKFTGNFAPVNQILGLFKYGRGKALPPIADAESSADEVNEAEETTGRRIAVMPGGFKPPHIGHFEGAKFLSEQADEVHILISPLPRAEHDGENRIEVTAEQSEALWNLYVRENGLVGKIKPYTVDVPSPVKAGYDFMDGMDDGDTIILGRGAKDEADTRFAKAQSYSDKNNLGVTVEQPLIPMSSGNISGTKMRKFILAGDVNSFLGNIPLESEDAKQKAIEILGLDSTANENKKKLSIQQLREMVRKILVETSSMASGAVDGGASSSNDKVVKKKRKVYNPFNEEVDDRYETEISGEIPGSGIKMLKQGLQLPREKLPQVKSTDMDDFKEFLKDVNVDWEDTIETVGELEPIQAEINLEKINYMMQNKSEEELGGGKPVIISSDGYLIDGHHRWFSLREMNPEGEMSVVLIDSPVENLLAIMDDYPKVSYKGADEVKESLIIKILNRLVEAGTTYDTFKGDKYILDIDNMAVIATKHGEERRFRHKGPAGKGMKISKDSIVSGINKAMGDILQDFANGEISNNEPFTIRARQGKQPMLNIVAALDMKPGPDAIKIITVMRKDDFKTDNFSKGGKAQREYPVTI